MTKTIEILGKIWVILSPFYSLSSLFFLKKMELTQFSSMIAFWLDEKNKKDLMHQALGILD